MASGQPKPALTGVATGDQSQCQPGNEKSAEKSTVKKRQNKSVKNRNRKKAKMEEEEYRKSVEGFAASVDARHREFAATALFDPCRVSLQGNNCEPFIVDSTQLQPANQWQNGWGSFNSQCTRDTVGNFESHFPNHPYHSHSTTSHSSQSISIPAGGISMGSLVRSLPGTRSPDHYVIQSHGIYFGGHSDSTSSLNSEAYSGYQGPQLQSPPYLPPYQASKYCHPPEWQGPNQPVYPAGASFGNGNVISQPCTPYFPHPNYAHIPPIPQYRPAAECPSLVPNMPFDEENGAQNRESSSMVPNGWIRGALEAERHSEKESEIRNVRNLPDRQTPQLCTGPVLSRGYCNPHHDFGEELQPVAAYILEAFRSGEYADFRLILNSSAKHCPTVSFPLHSLVASRSPHLKELMKTMDPAVYPKEIHVTAAGSFSHPFALGMALEHFYGVPLIAEEQLDDNIVPGVEHNNGEDQDQLCGKNFRDLEKMNFTLGYIASATFLAESNILRRGIRLAASMICWDNLEVLLRFGISVSNFMISPVGIPSMSRGAASSPTLQPSAMLLSSSNEQVMQRGFVNGDNPDTSPYTLNRELKDVWAPQLVNEAIDFIVKYFPQNFQLDSDAYSRELLDRLSGQVGSRFYLRDISALTFGSFAAAKNCTFRKEERVMSAIFLAVPFKILKKIFSILKVKGILTMGIAEDIVFERERRRIRAVRTVKKRAGTSMGSDAKLTISKMDPIGWREEIMAVTGIPDSSPSIIKTWVGLNVPEVIEIKPKKGACRGVSCNDFFGV
ncbi:hypothetical protein AJ78_03711 [Emergomyces pasteurianus Ep9510]|uniref:BTB domain-containing protein n=1 Tax=Emergomyces pasteurianus Ep9510 TaxID=1447872 RepID=A0A1J9PJ65_9EURO|nr:hypothetical protein AJ78_03711 [Emergomyces pasteurianus Ep9510]